MSTLRVTNVQDTSGGNSLTTAQIYNGAAKAWVNFNGTGTVAIRAQFNVSSITDNGTGDYTVNFTTAMADANYGAVACTTGTSNGDAAGTAQFYGNTTGGATLKSTSQARFTFGQSNTGGAQDRAECNVAIFR
jgi:hypothetical protein